jgi:acetyl esterase
VREVAAAWARYGDLASVSPSEALRIAEDVRAPWTRGGPAMASTKEIAAPVRMRVYRPSGAPSRDAASPALVYLHGGGWTLFSIDTHDRVMREYAARAGIVVIGIDYALAPESKYPVALDQISTALRFVRDHADELGIDRARIAIGGDSAGANLALAAALRDRDIRALVLNYGVFARHSSADAIARFGGPGNMLTAEEMEGFWRNYLRDERDADDPLVCPLLATLDGLPPAFLAVPDRDLLAEQSIALGDRLRAAGVPVETRVYRGATHSFLEAVSISSLASRAFDDTAAWLRATL